MQAGRLRHNVQLYAPPDPTSPDTFGDVSADYVAAGQAWVCIEPGNGREFWLAKSSRADLTHVVTMRYDPRLGPGWRLVWNDGHRTRTFELGPPAVTDERFFEMKFTAVEKKAPT